MIQTLRRLWKIWTRVPHRNGEQRPRRKNLQSWRLFHGLGPVPRSEHVPTVEIDQPALIKFLRGQGK